MLLYSDPHSRPSCETSNTAAVQVPAPCPHHTLPIGCLSLTITQSNLLYPAARFYDSQVDRVIVLHGLDPSVPQGHSHAPPPSPVRMAHPSPNSSSAPPSSSLVNPSIRFLA